METVTIVFKSGAKVRAKVKGLVVTYKASDITRVAWETFEPRPLFQDVTEIAAIYLGKV